VISMYGEKLYLSDVGEEWLESYEQREDIFNTSNMKRTVIYLILNTLEENAPIEMRDLAKFARDKATSFSGEVASWDLEIFYPIIQELYPRYISIIQMAETPPNYQSREYIGPSFNEKYDEAMRIDVPEFDILKCTSPDIREKFLRNRPLTREEKSEADQDLAAWHRQNEWERGQGIIRSLTEERIREKEFDRLSKRRFGKYI